MLITNTVPVRIKERPYQPITYAETKGQVLMEYPEKDRRLESRAPWRPKILIVDDSPENRALLSGLLSIGNKYEPIAAKDGFEALSYLDNPDGELPDLILLDVMMPGVTGHDVANRLRGDKRTGDIPIIFVTALDDIESKKKAFENGGVDYISKPFNREELFARINSHIRIKGLRDQLKEKNEQLKELNSELEARNGELARLNDLKNQFIGIVAHDLRNPLTVVMAVGSLLENQFDKQSNEKQRSLVSSINTSCLHMLDIINDLLDVKMIDSGRLAVNPMPTDMAKLAKKNVDFNTNLSSHKNIAIILSTDGNMPPAKVDSTRIDQLLNNLLSNAVKYSNPGSTVRVAVVPVGETIEISVADEGQGIPAEELEMIFEPFKMASPKPTSGEKSTGLGLAIAKKIVDAHNGRISVESSVGVGTTFTVALPI
jgi:two-component system, sensor histidine kinase and response regulator